MLISLSKAKRLFTGKDPWMSHVSDNAFRKELQEEVPGVVVHKGEKWFVDIEDREALKRLSNYPHRDIALGRSLPQVAFIRRFFERTIAVCDQTVANTLYWGRKALGFLDNADDEKGISAVDIAEAGYSIANIHLLPENTGECFMINLLAKVWERELEDPGFAWKAAQNGIISSLIPKMETYSTGYLALPTCVRGRAGRPDRPACFMNTLCYKAIDGYCNGSRGGYYGRCTVKIPDYISPDEINFLASAYWSYKNVDSLQEIDSDIVL